MVAQLDFTGETPSGWQQQAFVTPPLLDAGTYVVSVNANNFFASDTTGAKLPARIVPAGDGTFAWLFFQGPMPGASTITVTVDGSTIRGTCRGAGAVYRLGFDGSWWCTCDARSLCSHLVAAQLVCRVPMPHAVTSRPMEATA